MLTNNALNAHYATQSFGLSGYGKVPLTVSANNANVPITCRFHHSHTPSLGLLTETRRALSAARRLRRRPQLKVPGGYLSDNNHTRTLTAANYTFIFVGGNGFYFGRERRLSQPRAAAVVIQ